MALRNFIPLGVRNYYRYLKNYLFRSFIIQSWDKNGRPTPPPHVVKQDVINKYRDMYGCKTFVESGTYMGDMLFALRNKFENLLSIELSEDLWKNAVRRFSKRSNIQVLQGDSGKVLPSITPNLKTRSLFWLDGHYSGDGTAKGDKDCPIIEELDAIFEYNAPFHIVLIDDARLFVGQNDYPTMKQMEEYVHAKSEGYRLKVENDIIVLYFNV